MEEILNIPIASLIESPYQGRLVRKPTKRNKSDDPAMKSLIDSIKNRGLLTPIIVRQKDAKYEIIDGHRRVEAYRRLKIAEIPSLVKEYNDKDTQVFSIVGNLMRKNLNLIEKAIAFKKIIDSNSFKNVKEFSIAIGKNDTFVGDILNTLIMDKRIIEDLVKNRTTDDVRLLRDIRKIEKATDNKSDKQWTLYEKFKTEHLSRAKIKELVKKDKRNQIREMPIVTCSKSEYLVTFTVNDSLSNEMITELSEYLAKRVHKKIIQDALKAASTSSPERKIIRKVPPKKPQEPIGE